MKRPRLILILLCLAALIPSAANAVYNGSLETGYGAVGAIVITYSGGGGEAMCTGVLAGDSWVLTAAHGFETGSTAVFLLGSDASDPDATIDVDQVTIHPAYDPGDGANDIAMLHLATPVTSVTPMSPSTASPALLVVENVVVVGLGQTDSMDPGGIKRRCTNPVIAYYGTEHLLETDCQGVNCGPYYGDAGAPAIADEAGTARVVGICSRITIESDLPVAAYFVALADYASFLADATATEPNADPQPPQLASPADGETGLGTTVTFSWNESVDADGDGVDYRLVYATDEAFSDATVVDVEGSSAAAAAGTVLCTFPLLLLVGMPVASRRARALIVAFLLVFLVACPNPEPLGSVQHEVSGLQPGTTYYWKVEAVDTHGGVGTSEVWSFTTD